MNENMPEGVRQAFERLAENERRLGILIPAVMMDLLSIEDTTWPDYGEVPFEDRCERWLNAAVDGFLDFSEWQLASNDNWFESVTDIAALNQIVIFAAISESHLCLDYREKGSHHVPKVVYIETHLRPTTVCIVAEDAEEFARAIIERSKMVDDQ